MTHDPPRAFPGEACTSVPIQPRGPRCHPATTHKLPGDTSGAGHDNYIDKEAGGEAINQWHCADFLSINLSNYCTSLALSFVGQ